MLHNVKATILVMIFSLLISSQAMAQANKVESISFMTFNAKFLWDGIQPEEGSNSVKFPWKGNRALAAKHMEAIAAIIKRHNPDMVNLIEVENKEALELFNSKYLQGLGYGAYLVNGTDSFTGQDVALLSKHKPTKNAIYRYNGKGQAPGGQDKAVSKNYFTLFNIGRIKLAVVGVHLLSWPDDPSKKQPREAQANAIAKLAGSLQKSGYKVIVAGDFNDYSIYPLDRNENKPISSTLEIIRTLATKDDKDDLVNVMEWMDQGQRYTAIYDKNRDGLIDIEYKVSAIDHIYISQGLINRLKGARIDHNVDKSISDHFPIIINISTK